MIYIGMETANQNQFVNTVFILRASSMLDVLQDGVLMLETMIHVRMLRFLVPYAGRLDISGVQSGTTECDFQSQLSCNTF